MPTLPIEFQGQGIFDPSLKETFAKQRLPLPLLVSGLQMSHHRRVFSEGHIQNSLEKHPLCVSGGRCEITEVLFQRSLRCLFPGIRKQCRVAERAHRNWNL